MDPEPEFIRSEIPDVKSIVKYGCCLEGQRHGKPVDSHDQTIRERVAQIILNGAGAYLRRKHSGQGN